MEPVAEVNWGMFHAMAAVLLGAARQSFHHVGLPVFASPHFTGAHQACEAQARAAVGDAAFEAAYRRGSGFSLAQAVSYALGVESPESGAVPRTGLVGFAGLSESAGPAEGVRRAPTTSRRS